MTMALDFLYGPGSIFFSRLCGHRESGLLQRNHADVARPGRRGRTGDPSGTVVDWILHEELFYIVV